jgi:hypothetical protein
MLVEIIHRNGTVRQVECEGLELSKSPVANIRFGYAGLYQANLTHGWLESPASDWRLSDSDLERLRADADAAGKKVWPMPRSPGRPRQPKAPPRVHPKQTSWGF